MRRRNGRGAGHPRATEGTRHWLCARVRHRAAAPDRKPRPLAPAAVDHGEAMRARAPRLVQVRWTQAADRIDGYRCIGGYAPEFVPAERHGFGMRRRRLDRAEHDEIEPDRHGVSKFLARVAG